MRNPWLLATAAYTALALALCHAVVAHPATTLPSDLGDPVLNTWIIWWNAHAVPFTARWWNAPFFFPSHGALALSETLIGLAVVTTPLQWIGLSPVAAYNVAFIGSFPACALAMHLLVWRLTRRHDAAFVAALVYGFNPYRIAHAPHLQLLSSYWLPLALAGLHEYCGSGRVRGLALFAVSWLFQSLISGYFLFYSSVLIALWALWFASISWRKAAAIAAAWSLAAIACVPLLLEYQRVQRGFFLERGIDEIESFGADVSALLAPADRLVAWGGRLIGPRPEGELFVGFTALLLVLLAVVRTLRRPIGRVPLALAAVAAVPAILGLTAFWFGGFAIGSGAVRVSVARAFKPISVAVWLVLLAALASRPFRDAARRRSAFAFYAIGAAVMVMFAFGPSPRVWGHRFWYWAPYRWLLELPGFNGIRVPARFGALFVLCIAAAAGAAFNRLRPAGGRPRAVWLVVVLAGIALDSAARLPGVRVPPTIESPDLERMAAVVELPLGDSGADVRAMFRAMTHRRPLVNGYSGYAPPHYTALLDGLAAGDRRTFAVLTRTGTLGVLVADADDEQQRYGRTLVEAGARQVARKDGFSIFALDEQPVADPSCSGAPLTIASARAGRGNDPARAFDGDVTTAWHSGDRQSGGEQVVIDLGAPYKVDAITMALGPFARDFPRRLRIDVGPDESSWTEAWSGDVASYALEAALADPKTVPVRIPVRAASSARFVALTQTGGRNAMWSVAEIQVCGR